MTDDELAARLDLDVDDIGICLACLSFVSFAIHSGDARERETSGEGGLGPRPTRAR